MRKFRQAEKLNFFVPWGGGRKKGMKWDSQSGRTRERRRKILQYCVTFCKTNRTKRWKPLRKGVRRGSKRYGTWEFQTPLSPPHYNTFWKVCILNHIFKSNLSLNNGCLQNWSFCAFKILYPFLENSSEMDTPL